MAASSSSVSSTVRVAAPSVTSKAMLRASAPVDTISRTSSAAAWVFRLACT
jgi:hypothetical protein